MASADDGEEREEVIHLYTDNDSSDGDLVAEARRSGLVVLTTPEAGNRDLSDLSQLEFASIEGWTIYTANVGDFARLHREWLNENRTHGGIIVRFNQPMSIGEQLRRLLNISATIEQADMANQFIYLDTWEFA